MEGERVGGTWGESPGLDVLMDKILHHPCYSYISLKGDLLGACRLPHFIFLARYSIHTLKHISWTEQEETLHSWTFGCFKCRDHDHHLDKCVYHLYTESAFSPRQIVTFPRPPHITTQGYSALEVSLSCLWAMWAKWLWKTEAVWWERELAM